MTDVEFPTYETKKLPPGWEWATLDSTCQIIQGQSPPSYTYNTQRIGLPFFQGKAEFGEMYPIVIKWCSDPGKVAEAEDVLISIRAPVGPTNLAQERSCIGRGLVALHPELQMPSRYFLYFLRHIEQDLAAQATGTTFSAISGDVLRNLMIPIAPFDEQHRIVDAIETLLSRLDAGVAALKRLQANLKRYKASILKAASEGRLVPQDPNDEPASELLNRILTERRTKWEADQLAKYAAQGKEPPKGWQEKYIEPRLPDTTNLPELPSGWVWACVEQVGNVQLGRQRSPNNRSQDYPTKYIRAANITEAGLDLTDVLEMEFKPHEKGIYHLEQGDIVLSEASGSPDQVGKPAVWNSELDECCFQNTVIRLRPIGIASSYLLNLFKNFYVSGVFAIVASGVGINHLSAGKFSKLLIPIAPINEQDRIANEIEAQLTVIDKTALNLADNLRRANHLRQSILKHAFNGKLVPQSSNNEPASILLERIHEEREAREQAASEAPTVKRERTVAKQKEKKPLYDTLVEAGKPLTPEQLFEQSGFTVELIETFYEELRREVRELERIKAELHSSDSYVLEVRP